MSAAKALSSDVTPQGSPESRPVEPSMEDILASIRRIIADDQSRHTSPPTPTLRPPAAGSRSVPPVSRSAAPVSPPSRRTEPVPARPAPPPRPAAALNGSHAATPAPHLNPPVSPPPAVTPDALTPAATSEALTHDALIDDIASAGAAAALQPPPPAAAPPAPASPGEPVTDIAVAERLAETASPTVDAAPLAPADSTARSAAQPDGHPTAAPPEPAADEPAVALGVAQPAAAEPAKSEPEPAVAEPLVSARAGATIETSFHALETSVFMQNHGLVESLARDMLRPMLKSWLDDNLPAIVERLVRIEIERVARGGRA